KPPFNKKTIERNIKKYHLPIDSVKAILVNAGYLDASVIPDSGEITITSGPLYMVKKIIIQTDSVLEISVDLPFNRQKVERFLNFKLKEYYQQGYLYSSFKTSKIIKKKHFITIVGNLSLGPQLVLDKKIIKGLKRTDPAIVKKYVPFKSGEVLNDKNMISAENGARAVPFLSFEPPLKIVPRPGYTQADLVFRFLERKQVQIEGGGGYIPNSSSSLVWNVKLGFQNLFGKGKRITLYSEKKEENHQLLNIKYTQPVFVFGLGSLHLGVATRDYRNLFYEFTLNGKYQTHFTPNFSAGIGFEWHSVEPTGNALPYHTFTANFTFERNSLNNLLNPSHGLHIIWTIGYSFRSYAVNNADSVSIPQGKSSFNETRNVVKLDWYKNIFKSFDNYTGLKIFDFETAEPLPPVSELFFIGGPGTIRGFRNEQFTAMRSLIGTVEPRWRFSNSYLFLFLDGVYLNNHIPDGNNNYKVDEFYRFGYGWGMAFIQNNRSLKMSFGWNRDLRFDQPRLSVEFFSDL
ncbi:MAG: BamA/TamA family outer membrane protein, partial [FCB group bacterium]|nr:BamA/TamA family outer membrane protein [FCB group bacterium]